MRVAIVVLAGLLWAACEDQAGPTAEVTEDTTEDAEVAAETIIPLDTALPDLGETDQNRDLRNGAIARVGHVTDGDTLQVWVGSLAPKSYVIRMKGLAAPECTKSLAQTPDGTKEICTADDEFWGLQSYVFMKGLVEGKTVRISCDVSVGAWCDQDVYDRYLAYIEVDGKDAATESAKAGAAFSYTDFASTKRAEICQAEYDAQDAKRGMWASGTIAQVVAKMNSSTQGWYKKHDSRCDAAINAN